MHLLLFNSTVIIYSAESCMCIFFSVSLGALISVQQSMGDKDCSWISSGSYNHSCSRLAATRIQLLWYALMLLCCGLRLFYWL